MTGAKAAPAAWAMLLCLTFCSIASAQDTFYRAWDPSDEWSQEEEEVQQRRVGDENFIHVWEGRLDWFQKESPRGVEDGELTGVLYGVGASLGLQRLNATVYPVPETRYLNYQPHLDFFLGYVERSGSHDLEGPAANFELRLVDPDWLFTGRLRADHWMVESASGVKLRESNAWVDGGLWVRDRLETGVYLGLEEGKVTFPGTNAIPGSAAFERVYVGGLWARYVGETPWEQNYTLEGRLALTELDEGPRQYDGTMNTRVSLEGDFYPSRLWSVGGGFHYEEGEQAQTEGLGYFARVQANWNAELGVRVEISRWDQAYDGVDRDETRIATKAVMRF